MRRRTQSLTAREHEVLELVRQGLTNDEIAGRLSITSDGVKYHVTQILTKLGVSSRHEAVAVVFGERRRSWWSVALASALLKAVGVAIAVVAIAFLAVLTWSVFDSSDGDEAVTGHTSNVYRSISGAVSRDGQILHTTVSTQQGNGTPYTIEMWVDGQEGAIRYEVPPNTNDSDATPRETTAIINKGFSYVRESDGAAVREEAQHCEDLEPWLSAFILCEPAAQYMTEDGTWSSEPAIVLIGERTVVIPTPQPNLVTPRATEQSEPISSPPNIPTEVLGGVETFVSRLYLDYTTYLPIAWTSQQTLNGEEVSLTQLNFEHEFLPRSDDLVALFDPRSIGYEGE